MPASKNADARQLAKRVFDALKENDLATFENDFKRAYDTAIAQYHLGTFRAGELFSSVKQQSKTLLEEHARKTEKRSSLPDYFRLRRPVPLLDYEKSALGSLC